MANVKDREPLLYVGVGKKGVGKTYQTIKIINNYLKGNPSLNTKPRKVLIIDVNNEYVDYKRLHANDLIRFVRHKTVEARRIVPFYRDGRVMSPEDLMEIYKFASENFRNGLLLPEDITKFVGDAIPADVVGHMCTNRHRDVDIISHFQSIGKAGHPKIKANLNILRLHKTLDGVDRHKDKFAEFYEIVKIGEMLVNSRYEQFIKANKEAQRTYFGFFVYIDFDRSKIIGDFGRNEFEQIITDYIQVNERAVLNPILNKKDRNGKKVYSYGEALSKVEQDLFEKYAKLKFSY